MGRYIVRRLLAAIPVLFGLSVILFAFIHLIPGDPASVILGQHATPELVAQVRAQTGFELLVSDEITELTPPSEEEIAIYRELRDGPVKVALEAS